LVEPYSGEDVGYNKGGQWNIYDVKGHIAERITPREERCDSHEEQNCQAQHLDKPDAAGLY